MTQPCSFCNFVFDWTLWNVRIKKYCIYGGKV